MEEEIENLKKELEHLKLENINLINKNVLLEKQIQRLLKLIKEATKEE